MNDFIANKFDSLYEMEKFLENFYLPKLILEEIENLESLNSIKEAEFIIKSKPDTQMSHCELYFKKKTMINLT